MNTGPFTWAISIVFQVQKWVNCTFRVHFERRLAEKEQTQIMKWCFLKPDYVTNTYETKHFPDNTMCGVYFGDWVKYLAPSWCRKCIRGIWSKLSCWTLTHFPSIFPARSYLQRHFCLSFSRNISLLNDVSRDVKSCFPTKVFKKNVKFRN